MPKRAILLARVSTKDQNDNYSKSTQLAAMRAYAVQHGFTVVLELEDEISGATPVAERPSGKILYDLMLHNQVEVVIMYTIDRVARDDDVLEFAIFKRDCKRAGVELHLCDTGKTADTIMGNLMEQFRAAAAAEERQKIRERTTRGRLAKARSGKWVGIKTPFGYRKLGLKSEARLEPVENESALIRRIFAMYLGMEGNARSSMHEIAYKLSIENVPTPRGARRWYQTTVRHILSNRLYIGEIIYAGHIAAVPQLAIIPREWFETVQTQIKKNQEFAKRNRRHEYLLSNRFRCVCGRALFGVTRAGNRFGQYRCSSQNKGRKLQRDCQEKPFLMQLLEELVWNQLLAELDEQTLAEGIRAKVEHASQELQPKRARLQTVEELLEKAEKRIRKLIQAFAESDDETISAEFQSSLKEARRQKDALSAERERLQKQLERGVLSEKDAAAIQETARQLRRKIEGGAIPTFAQKRHLLDVLDVRAQVIKEGEKRIVSIKYALSCDPVSIDITNYSKHVRQDLVCRRAARRHFADTAQN